MKSVIGNNLEKELRNFIQYITFERGLSENTKYSYQNDLMRYAEFLDINNIRSFKESKSNFISEFLYQLNELGLGAATRSRYLSSIRGLHKYLFSNGLAEQDVSEVIDVPNLKRKIPEVLTYQEINNIIEQPDISNPAGIRDRALLEVLYACGLRVSEIIELKQRDIVEELEIIRVFGKGSKERYVPIGKSALNWIEIYRKKSRTILIKNKDKIGRASCRERV